jgi:hypothetical protein
MPAIVGPADVRLSPNGSVRTTRPVLPSEGLGTTLQRMPPDPTAQQIRHIVQLCAVKNRHGEAYQAGAPTRGVQNDSIDGRLYPQPDWNPLNPRLGGHATIS